jgi:chromosome segregation ATPase
VTVKGIQIMVENESLWPEGKTIAEGMRKAAKGCKAASAEMASVKKELPKLRASLDESLKVVKTSRQALATAVADEEKLAPVLRRLPQALARLAEALPDMTAELARALRETARLKEVAAALRQTQKSLDATAARWPGLSVELTRAAKMLSTTRGQLETALERREQFEAAVRHTVELTAAYADSLPRALDELEEGLARQEKSLGELGNSIDRLNEDLPRAARSAGRVLWTVRLLVALLAGLAALHAGHRLMRAMARPKAAEPSPA